MVFKASRLLAYRKFETAAITLLLSIGLAMTAASNDGRLDVTIESVTSSSFTTRNFDDDLLAVNALYNETDAILTKIRNNSTNDWTAHFTQKNHIRILKKVRTALKIARIDFRIKKDMTAQLYADAKYMLQNNDSKSYYHYNWLPSQSLVWYNETVAKLDKDKRAFVLLPALRHWLINFSVTLKQMLQFNKPLHSEFYTLRKSILTDLYRHLVAVLAEVEMSPIVVARGRQWSADETPSVFAGDGADWDPNPDRTTMLIQDWGVLTTYYRFLKDWTIISREMVRDQRSSGDDGDPAAVTGTTAAAAAAATGSPQAPSGTTAASGAAPSKRRSSAPCIRHGSGGSKRRKSPNLLVAAVKSSSRRRN